MIKYVEYFIYHIILQLYRRHCSCKVWINNNDNSQRTPNFFCQLVFVPFQAMIFHRVLTKGGGLEISDVDAYREIIEPSAKIIARITVPHILLYRY